MIEGYFLTILQEISTMSPKYALVLWTKTQKISVVAETSVVKSFEGNGEETPVCEGAIRMFTIADKRFEAKVLRVSSSKKFLESLLVTKDGKVLLLGSKPPSQELLAKKSKLQDEEAEEANSERGTLQPLNSNSKEHPPTNSRSKNASECCHGCPSCCSGNLPPFPPLPEGFVSTLVSLAEYFQQFKKATADKVTQAPRTDMSKNLNTWQWASREKIELKKGAGVWIDAIKLEKIMGQADITKKPPHQTLVKSLLLDLMGLDRYVETTAEKMDRRLVSSVVGFANAKYPELAQPIERYYRCINLNRGYMQKRRNEGAFENPFEREECSEDVVKPRKPRSYRKQAAEDLGDTRTKRVKRNSGIHKDAQPSENSSPTHIFDDLDQLIIPLDGENEDGLPTVTSNNIDKILVVQANSKSLPSSASYTKPPADLSDIHDLSSGSEDGYLEYENSNIKNEDDLGHIEGALDILL